VSARKALTLLVVAALVLSLLLKHVSAQVPVTVWGYIKMPDGSPAAGASVTVKAGSVTASTTAGSDGKYQVDLTVPSVPVTVTVTAVKGEYSGSASKTGEGVIRIDVVLQKAAPPPPPPPSKKLTRLSITAYPVSCVRGEAVTIIGNITPAMKVSVTLSIKAPNGSRVSVELQTDDKGSFSYTFTPDSVGVWEAFASFPGNSEYQGSTSPTVQIAVKNPTRLTLSALATQPKSVTLVGELTPSVEGAAVLIYVSIDNGKTWLNYTRALTGSDGRFRIILNITVSGSLLFKAVFPGSELLAPAEATALPAMVLSEAEVRLGEQLANLQKQNQELNRTLAALTAEKASLEEKVQSITREKADLENQLQSAKRDLEQLRGEAEGLRREVDALRTMTYVGIPLAGVAGAALGLIIGTRRRSQVQRPVEPKPARGQ